MPRPDEIDVRLARAFANRHGLALAAALLPARPLDAVGEPQEALDFLQPVLATAAELGSAALYGLSSGGLARITAVRRTAASSTAMPGFSTAPRGRHARSG